MKLVDIQKRLNVPKNQWNDFGKYNYRSCEDIVEALKPLLGDYHLILSDEIVGVGDRVYVKATATITNGTESFSATGYAREPLAKKGMDDSQITGAASSYARKYALNGLLAIDDTKDADSTDNRPKNNSKKQEDNDKPWFKDFYKQKAKMKEMIDAGERTPDQIISKLQETYKLSKATRESIQNLRSGQ